MFSFHYFSHFFIKSFLCGKIVFVLEMRSVRIFYIERGRKNEISRDLSVVCARQMPDPSFFPPLPPSASCRNGVTFFDTEKRGEIEKYFLLFTPPTSAKPDVGHVSFFPKQESDKYRRPQREKSETFEKQKVFFLERLGKTEEIGNRIGVLFPPPPMSLLLLEFQRCPNSDSTGLETPHLGTGKKGFLYSPFHLPC